MATNYEQTLVQQYGEPMQQLINDQRALGKGGALNGTNVDQQDVNRLVSMFQQVNPTSGQNVIDATTNPTYAPNYNDPYGALDAIGKSIGVDTATEAEKAAREELAKQQETTREILSGIQFDKNKTVGISAGEQSRERTLAANEENTLLSALNLATQQRQILENKAQQQFSIFQSELGQRRDLVATALQYGDNKVDINMSMEELQKRAADAQTKYIEQEKKDAEKKLEGEYKKQLQQIAIELGIGTKTGKGGTMNISQLEKAIAKEKKSALEEAKAWEKQQRDMEIAKYNKTMSGSDSQGDSVKAELYTQLASGQITRETAKAYYEIATGKPWDIYNDPRTADNVLPPYNPSDIPKKIGTDEQGDIFVNSQGERIFWVE